MGADSPLVTVLIPTFNSSRFIGATLDSALRQTLDAFEILVLDDGSSDDTAARVQAVRDPRVRLSRHSHRGAPAVMNDGLVQARGEFVAFLDHDDLWLPTKLARHLTEFERHPAAAVTFSWTGLIDEHDRPIALHPAHWRGAISFRQLLEDYVIGTSSSIVMRRAAIDRAGGFDERLPRCHDLDLTLRIAARHADSVIAVAEALTLYRRHSGQMSRDWVAIQSEWNAVFDKCLALAPAETRAAEPRARSNINRYFAYLAYEAERFGEARRLVRQSMRAAPGLFVRDVRNWKIAAACGAELMLPSAIHRRLERLAGIQRDGQ